MRAMRQTLALCVLLMAAAGCGDDTNGGPDMSMPLDMTAGPDMAVRVPNGVACGGMTCSTSQSCCVQVMGMTPTSSCIAAGGQCAGGAVLACDGPEDCSSASKYCCGTIKFMQGNPDGGTPVFNGGDAMCTATCDFSFGQSQVKTRLCQADVDCAGLTAFGMAVDKCCSSAQAPGIKFCAAPIAGITCP
jgi:hypothetical protein